MPAFETIKTYVKEIRRCIPMPFLRHGVINSLEDSMQNAFSALSIFHRFFEVEEKGTNMDGVSILAFGSIGRLESCISISDVEMMFVCRGDRERTNCRTLLKKWVRGNRSSFNVSADDIKNAEKGLEVTSFPILTVDELLQDGKENRRIQMLLESKPIKKYTFFKEVYFNLLQYYGYPDNFPNSKFFSDFDSYTNSLRSGFIDTLQKAKKYGGKYIHKTVKALLLRYTFEVTVRVTIAKFLLFKGFDPGYMKSPPATMHCILACDNFSKLLEWIRPHGKFNHFFMDTSNDVAQKLKKRIAVLFQKSKKDLSRCAAEEMNSFYRYFSSNNEFTGPIENIGTILMLVCRDYDYLLSRLHDDTFVNELLLITSIRDLKQNTNFKQFEEVIITLASNMKVLLDFLCGIMEEAKELNIIANRADIINALDYMRKKNKENLYQELFDILA